MSRLPSRPRALVTGGASGLGRSLATALGRRGGRVLVTDVDLQGARQTARLVGEAGGEGEALELDVTDPAAWQRSADEVQARFGELDLLVNNAGVAAGGRVGDIPLEDWEWILRVNLWGVIHGCHTFVPRMRAQGGGHILNVASAAGFASLAEMGSYNLTKAGVISLSETLHAECGADGVRVSVLCPTFFASGLMRSFRSPEPRQREVAEAFFRRSRVGADEVAEAALAGLERGRLHIVPMWDARLTWWAKRLVPGLYARALRRGHHRLADWLVRR